MKTATGSVSVSLQDLLELKKQARELSLSRLKANSKNTGKQRSLLLARGMEFEQSRRYLPCDDVRNIDWRVTARTGKTHTKLFTEEKENKVVVAIDMRAPMFFATEGVFKSVQAAKMAATLSWSAVNKGHLLGGFIFNEETVLEFKPALLKKSLFPFLNQIAELSQVKPIKKEDATLEAMLQKLTKKATPGSLVFLISDFRQMSAAAKDLMIQVARRCDLCLIFLHDKIEADLPKNGYYPVTDGNVVQQLNTYHEKSLNEYRKKFELRKTEVASLQDEGRIHFMECSTKDDCLEILQTHLG